MARAGQGKVPQGTLALAAPWARARRRSGRPRAGRPTRPARARARRRRAGRRRPTRCGRRPQKRTSRTASIGGVIGFPQCRKLTSVGWSSIGPRRSPPASNEYMIGVRKNHGSSSAATMCSTSRKMTFAAATASESPATSATTGTISGIVSQMVSRVSGMTIMFTGISTTRIATSATSCAATVESAVSWRGKRTFLIRFALSSSERADVAATPRGTPRWRAPRGDTAGNGGSWRRGTAPRTPACRSP